MKVIRRPSQTHNSMALKQVRQSCASTAVTIGNFDGVHRGHEALLRHVSSTATAHQLVPTVITLHPHPKELFDPTFKLSRISTLRDRIIAMRNCGIEQVCILPFDKAMASLAPQDFVDEVLVSQLNVRQLWVGDDFRFGAKRAGDFALLQELGKTRNFEVHNIEQVQQDSERISSSAIRAALAEGQVATATALLGRPLTYSGHVRHGKKLGRTLGFPTMNLAFEGRASALTGILAVWVHGLEEKPLAAVASMGVRPTVEQSDQILLETFIPNWQGNAYGKLITVEVIAHLRPEQHFSDMDLMVQQMHKDTELAMQILHSKASRLEYHQTTIIS